MRKWEVHFQVVVVADVVLQMAHDNCGGKQHL